MLVTTFTNMSGTTVPPHLNQPNWLEYEQLTVESLFESLSDELDRISRNATAKRVHDTRVALRRWDSIWAVLERDGWRTKRYWKNVGKHLKRLRKALGELRDWDVNLETGHNIGLPKAILKDWGDEREKNHRTVRRQLKKIDMGELLKEFGRFIRTRPKDLRQLIAEHQIELLAQTAYTHLEPYLREQEEITSEIEREANTPESMHRLRLSIKAWRYLLTEFYGLTNLQLVRAQQILGKYNDVIRALRLLEDDKKHADLAKVGIENLESQSEQLLKEFSEFRKDLPYGLRPFMASVKRRK